MSEKSDAGGKYVVSRQTEGRVVADLPKLRDVYGSRVVDEVPMTAQKAEVIFTKGEAVTVVWTCIARREIVERLAPELLQADAKFGDWKQNDQT